MGLLDQFTQAVDARKRYYGNIVRGLLDNPQALMEQLQAQNAENVREQSRSVQDTRSVMPGIAEPAKQAAFDEAMNVGLLGLTAYHGSPYQFDKFDMSKIGTGQGAQAYSHGLYFAENPAVARRPEYMNPKGNAEWTYFYDGQPYSATDESVLGRAARVLSSESSKAEAIKTAKARDWDDVVLALRGMKKSLAKAQQGHFYTNEIPDEAVAKMLDWDKPLSQQPEAVKQAIEKSGLAHRGAPLAWVEPRGDKFHVVVDGQVERHLFNTQKEAQRFADNFANDERWYAAGRTQQLHTGQDFYRSAAGTKEKFDAAGWAEQDKQVSLMLRDLGIPGIRYLDAGSRGAGSGTRNFVVFDPEIIKILSRE